MKTIEICPGVTATVSKKTYDKLQKEKRDAEIDAANREWLSNPENREKYPDVYSDIYKDVYGVRPRW